jgi:hypothetical protein
MAAKSLNYNLEYGVWTFTDLSILITDEYWLFIVNPLKIYVVFYEVEN